MKRLYFSILLAVPYLIASAQTDIDALRYSSNDIGLTARGLSVGGAFGALGGDLSGVGINPAGLGVYRSGGFILGAGMLNAKNTGTYNGHQTRDNEFSLNIPNLGFVFSNQKYSGREPAKEGWLYTNFSISMNRIANFNRLINYSGENNNTSMLDYFAQRSNGLTTSEIGASQEELNYGYNDLETMMWEAYLIDSVANRTYAAVIDPFDRNLNQRNTISSSGSMNNINLSLASNYNNKLYLGGGLDITTVKYRETNRFTEVDKSQNMSNWSAWELSRHLTTSGIGFSGHLGMIIRPNDHIRLGASLKTPTIFSLNDEYFDELSTSYDNGGDLDLRSSNGQYNYTAVTPLRTTVSAAYLFGKRGFISADAEILDYSTMRLRPVINAFELANDLIRTKYKSVANFRVGGEYVYDMFRFRAGVAQYGSPLYNVTEKNLQRVYLTGGIGIKEKDWALDLALVQKRGTEIIQPYTLDNKFVDYSVNKLRSNSLVISLSTSF